MARMARSRFGLPLVGVMALAAAGCAKRVAAPHPAAGCALAVQGDRILCDGRPYATVERYFCRSRKADAGAGSSGAAPAPGTSCFGIAVLYADGERAWLYRGESWDRAVATGAYVATSDTESKLGGAYGIRVSADGRVRFRLPLTTGAFEYALEDGVLRRVY
jgi:hypothetical protein